MKLKRKPYYIISLTKEEKTKLKEALEILDEVSKCIKNGQTDLRFEEGNIISNIHTASDTILRNIPREEEE